MVNDNGCVIALGNFDGLHRGHRKVISTAIEKAEQSELKAVVLLFDDHPCSSLGYEAPPKLMSKAEQKRIIREMGAECEEIEFSQIMNMECEEFVRDILIGKLNAKVLCCGFNYHFGKGGKGTVDTLSEIAGSTGLELNVSDALCYKDEPISSSRIRDCISRGNMSDANAMLGESFSYDFEVVGGDRIGRNLGAPTINQHFDQGFIVPLKGVYASKTYVDGQSYNSITNIGVRPTLDKTELRSETYIIDFSGDLYGRKIRVELIKYIRSEKKFSSLDELKQQIQTDCRIAREEKIMDKINVKAIFFTIDDVVQPEEESADSFDGDCNKSVLTHPYALDVLEEIKQRGYTTGIISNGDSALQNARLDAEGIADMLDVVIASEDYGFYKPDRRIFDDACRQAGYANEECLFVGEHPINDIQGALAADMRVVRINQGAFYNKDLDSNIPTIEDLRELLDLI